MVGCQGLGEGMGSYLMGTDDQFCKMKEFWRCVVMVVVNVLHATYKWLMVSFICLFYHIKKTKTKKIRCDPRVGG